MKRLRHVYWIGGGSGAGKSTIARRIAKRHDMTLYSTDDAMHEHGARSTPDDSPLLAKFRAMSMDDRWANRTPETMLETFHWFRGEQFNSIIEDLLTLPQDRQVIVEGFRLLPYFVKPFLEAPNHAVWLLPTPEFRRQSFDHRGSTWKIAKQTSEPERALNNLLIRDAMFTRRLQQEVADIGGNAIDVDITMTQDDVEHQVLTKFKIQHDQS